MITRENILNLAEQEHDLCVSIYMKTHKVGEEVQQDPIRLKNLLDETRDRLKEKDVNDLKAEQMLEEPRKLLEKPSFWQHNDYGLALFISEDNFNYLRVPQRFDERIMIDNHFLITPLIPMITLQGTFSILALSQKDTRLLRATRDQCVALHFQEAVTSMEEYMKFTERRQNIQHHAGQGTRRGKGKAHHHTGGDIFHGHGVEGEFNDREVLNFLKQIESEATDKLRKTNDLLILAGMDRGVAEYKKINNYHRVMDEAIIRNPDDSSDKDLRNRGWEIIKTHFLNGMYKDIERLGTLTGSDKKSENLSKVVEASYYGRVDSLFVPIDEESWGWFDEENATVHHSAEQHNGEHDLLNMAAIKTLSQGGSVYAMERDKMPNNASVAAIFRYP